MKKVISAVLSVVVTAVMLIVPAAAASKLAAPRNLKVSEKTSSSVTLTWSAVENASKYTIYYSTKKKGDYEKYGAVAKTTATVKNLEPGTKYFFRVESAGKINGKTAAGSYSAISAITEKEKAAAAESSGSSLKITKSPGTVCNNDYATLKATGKPNTEYTLTVYYSSTASKAKGTGTIKSDASGNLTWSWKVGPKTKAGEHKIKITGNGETVETTFTTKK